MSPLTGNAEGKLAQSSILKTQSNCMNMVSAHGDGKGHLAAKRVEELHGIVALIVPKFGILGLCGSHDWKFFEIRKSLI